MTDQRGKLSKLAELRRRHEWLDHLLRAGQSYSANHGDHYAAAITYFSVLALVPLLMVAFAAVAFVVGQDAELMARIKAGITSQAPGALGETLGGVIDSAIASAGAVGLIGLLVALYSGLGWMSNLREALTEQWGQRHAPPPYLRRLGADFLALIGLGIALLLSLAVSTASGLAMRILDWLGLEQVPWLAPVAGLVGLLFALLADALVLLWVIARLPREAVTWRSAAKAAIVGAIGFEVLKQVLLIYLVRVTGSPAGVLFGPILGLMIFIFTISRFLLFLTSWAATARENRIEEPPPAPAPAVIRPEVTLRDGTSPGAVAGLLGAGVVAGLLGGRLLVRRGRS